MVLILLALAVVGLASVHGESKRADGHPASILSGQTVPAGKPFDPSSQAISAPIVNGVVNPMFYPGNDLGEKINSVFAAGNGCAQVHIPAGTYSYSTTIRMTKACQSLFGAGSALTTLEYKGNSDAILWQMQPYTIQKAGTLKGFTLKGPGTAGGNGIHSGTIIANTHIPWPF